MRVLILSSSKSTQMLLLRSLKTTLARSKWPRIWSKEWMWTSSIAEPMKGTWSLCLGTSESRCLSQRLINSSSQSGIKLVKTSSIRSVLNSWKMKLLRDNLLHLPLLNLYSRNLLAMTSNSSSTINPMKRWRKTRSNSNVSSRNIMGNINNTYNSNTLTWTNLRIKRDNELTKNGSSLHRRDRDLIRWWNSSSKGPATAWTRLINSSRIVTSWECNRSHWGWEINL